jgi:hypothetical protein
LNPANAYGIWNKHTIGSLFYRARDVHAADPDANGDTDVLAAGEDASDIVWWENTALSLHPPYGMSDL